jgi:phage terminase large subunit-like protein
VWLILAGRGFGKTRSAAEWVLEQAEHADSRIALVGRSAADVRDTMIDGVSGVRTLAPPWNRPRYVKSERRLDFPSGAQAFAYSAVEPDQLRGPEHSHAWPDELAAWPNFKAWDNLLMGLRRGDNPRLCASTTPRPLRILRELVAESTTHVTRASTYANARNLPRAFFDLILKRYEGTSLGAQELDALLLDEAPGALWKRKTLNDSRVRAAPTLVRIVVAIDPSVTAKPGSDETGIIIAGLGDDGHVYVFADASGLHTAARWAALAIELYRQHRADRIVGEANNGGDLVELAIRQAPGGRDVAYHSVHASRGKAVRAEPVAALFEQGRAHIVGMLPDLEDQLCSWVPGEGESPDRLDAMVWAVTELTGGGGPTGAVRDSSAPSRYRR